MSSQPHLPSSTGEAAQHALPESQLIVPAAAPTVPTVVEPSPAPGCEHLRHIIIGSPAGVQEAISRLHLLQYVERRQWTPLITIPEEGIRLTPAQGQVLSYLLQQRPIR